MPELPDRRSQQETQDELRLRVEQATEELKRTRAECEKIDAIAMDAAGTSDGTLAVRQSAELHRRAMERLREAMRAFEAFDRSTGQWR
jgi:hypothetical protein